MEIVAWVGAGILALNGFVIASVFLRAAARRYRIRREIELLDSLPHAERLRALGHAGRARSVPSLGTTLTAAPPAPLTPPRRRALTFAALGAALTLAFGGLVLIGTDPREAVNSAVGVVMPGLDLSPNPSRGGDGVRAAGQRGPDHPSAATEPGSAGARTGSEGAASPAEHADLAEFVPAKVTGRPTSSTEIRLEWAIVPIAIGYEVERSEDGSADWLAVAQTGQETSYVDSGLAAGTTYHYRVSALTESGEAPPSDVITVTTVELASPTGLAVVTATSSSIELTWNDVAGETGYRVERSPDGSSGWMIVGALGADATSYLDPGLTSETTYHYRVIAVNEAGESTPSSVASVTTNAVLAPVEPEGSQGADADDQGADADGQSGYDGGAAAESGIEPEPIEASS